MFNRFFKMILNLFTPDPGSFHHSLTVLYTIEKKPNEFIFNTKTLRIEKKTELRLFLAKLYFAVKLILTKKAEILLYSTVFIHRLLFCKKLTIS